MAVHSCKVWVIVIDDMNDFDELLYYGVANQFTYYSNFVVIVENRDIAIEEVMKVRLIGEAHSLVILQPISPSIKYAAYRSTFLKDNPIELFDILQEKSGFKSQIFNEKLSDFHGQPTNVYCVKYPPNVVVTTDEFGKQHFSGFEVEMMNELGKAVNSELFYHTHPEPYFFENLVPN